MDNLSIVIQLYQVPWLDVHPVLVHMRKKSPVLGDLIMLNELWASASECDLLAWQSRWPAVSGECWRYCEIILL